MTITGEIVPADLREQQVAVMHARVGRTEIPAFLAKAYERIPRQTAEQGLRVTGPPYARFHVVTGDAVEIEAGFPVSGPVTSRNDVEAGVLPGGHVATTVHVGPYETVAGAYEALERYLGKNGYEPAGDPWESYLDSPDVPRPRTKVYLPARRLGRRPPG